MAKINFEGNNGSKNKNGSYSPKTLWNMSKGIIIKDKNHEKQVRKEASEILSMDTLAFDRAFDTLTADNIKGLGFGKVGLLVTKSGLGGKSLKKAMDIKALSVPVYPFKVK